MSQGLWGRAQGQGLAEALLGCLAAAVGSPYHLGMLQIVPWQGECVYLLGRLGRQDPTFIPLPCLDPWQPKGELQVPLGAPLPELGALPLWRLSQHTQAGNLPCVHGPVGYLVRWRDLKNCQLGRFSYSCPPTKKTNGDPDLDWKLNCGKGMQNQENLYQSSLTLWLPA